MVRSRTEHGAGSGSPGRSSGDDAPPLRVGRRAAGCSSRLGEELRGPQANPSASDRRAAQGVSDRCKSTGDPLAPGVRHCRRRCRPARWTSAGAAVAELVPGDALSVALRVPIEAVSALLCPARAALLRVEGRQKEWKNRVFWSVSTIRSLRRAAESVIHSDPTRRDDHCSRAYPGYVLAFTRKLQGGAAPMGPNPLDAPPSITAVASLGAVGPPAVSAQPLGPSPPPPTPPLPVYSTTQQPADALRR